MRREQVVTLAELLADQAQRRPEAAAIESPGRAPLTYLGLARQVDDTRVRLHAMGLGPDDRIALMLDNGPELATAFLALASTVACAPLNPAYREAELDFYLGDLGVSAAVVAHGRGDALRGVAAAREIRVIELVRSGEVAGMFELDGSSTGSARRASLPAPATTALLLHTSGTTSRPKLVPLTHANLLVSAANVAASIMLDDHDRCLNPMPLFHIHGLVAGVLAPLRSGGTTICTPAFDPAQFFNWLDTLAPTWYTAVPTMHQAILARASGPSPRRTSLRFVRSSSASLPRRVLDGLESTFGCPVIEAYGMTEATHQMATNSLPPGVRKPGSVGRPSGVEITIVDEAGTPVTTGETGEVAIRGPAVFGGYEGNPEANATAFVDGWFRTGDLGAFDDDGYLTLQGRSKEIINRGGEKVSPLEVEDVLLRHDAVEQAVAFAQPHATLGESVAAAVVVRDGASLSDRELRLHAAAHLADFKVPTTIILLDELPKGATGKIQRIGLAERLGLDARPTLSQSPHRAPGTTLEQRLVTIWEDLLEVEPIGIDDDFFALGGDSLVAAQLLGWIAAEGLGPEDLSLDTLLRTPTIVELARLIERGDWETPEDVVLVKDGGTGPRLFYVSGHDGQIVRFGPLASRLEHVGQCVALVLPDPDGSQAEITVECLAAGFVEAIRDVQPHGPYFLFGRCMGAGVVLEIARLLHADGEKVSFLGLLDPIGEHPNRIRRRWRLLRLWYSQGYLGRAVAIFLSVRAQRLIGRPVADTTTELESAMLAASARYVPIPYGGHATLFRTTSYQSPSSFWQTIVEGGLRVEDPVPTTQPEHFDQLAAQLDRELEVL